MSDPVLTLVLIALFFAAVGAARYFKTLDPDFGRAAASPVATGAVCGIVLLAVDRWPNWHPAIVGVILTLAAMYVRHVGEESEPIDGMLLGALTGAAAALPATIWRGDGPRFFAEVVIAGAVAGCGITFASFHVTDRARQAGIDILTAIAAVAGAALPLLLLQNGLSGRRTAAAVAAMVPTAAILSVFLQSADIRRELVDESAHGLVDETDIRRTAHPILRFRRGDWTDAAAYREFVRIANRIALRKRQQRGRPEEIARLYQLEIIKLRMQLQEMARIGRPRPAAADDDAPSDRMRA